MPLKLPDDGLWHIEWYTQQDFHVWGMEPPLVTARTRFQEVVIQDAIAHGRCLLLDDRVQSASNDEWIYHEALVHPAMTAHPNPRRVLILGGGEGATLREILRHPTVERATMVDIDGELVDLCRQHLPEWHQGAFDDPRADLVIGDARTYLVESPEQFDVIVGDLTDPIEDGVASLLYTRQFFELIRPRLAPGGIYSTQAVGLRYTFSDRIHAAIYSTLGSLFAQVSSYNEFLPAFDTLWAFVAASESVRLPAFTPAEIDDRLAERGLADILRYYDGVTHQRLFALPKNLRKVLAASTEIIEENKPLFVEW